MLFVQHPKFPDSRDAAQHAISSRALLMLSAELEVEAMSNISHGLDRVG